MTGFSADMLRVIDERIASRRDRVTAVGTVASRSAVSTVTALDVTFDGSSLAVPVKQFGGVKARAGDRVGLVKFGSEWVVVGSFTAFIQEDVGLQAPATIGSTTSATYTATAGNESFQFVKAWDDTLVKLRVDVGAYLTTTTGTTMQLGLSFAELGTTYDVALFVFNSLVVHGIVSGVHPGVSGIPAGNYTVGLRWKRPAGTGTLNQDTNDWVSIGASEVGP